MKTWEELRKTKEFWEARIRNDIFRFVKSYMIENGMNQSELAQDLGVSKGYVSQILNGNFNFSIKKLIELSLKLKIAPDIDFKPLQQFLNEEKERISKIDEDRQELEIKEAPTMRVKTSQDGDPKITKEKAVNAFQEIAFSNLDDPRIIKPPRVPMDAKTTG